MFALINEKNEVLEIKETEITNSNPDMKVVQINAFSEGDELSFYIIVNEVNEDNHVMSYSAVKQNPYVKELLAKNAELKAENEALKARQALTEKALEDLILAGGAL